ncbi:AIM24 family protein [Nakamurella sp. YIM 132087]|uniref:AIM24 family protein n=1 Tax=Nakamurella alba TaxID=2665158 RepID=A0A7K1FQA5_9ACTN|nr:AIM24 family protein [Nakamurella alba]MTD16332.1 AIM24 family protein [Nakamurella alba]
MPQFVANGKRIVDVHLQGDSFRARAGSMVAYQGTVAFKRAPIGGGEGIRGAMKRGLAGEGLELMECTGHGVVHLAVDAAYVEIVQLTGDKLMVESSSLLAYDTHLTTGIAFHGLRGLSGGQGVATTTISGAGTIALLSFGGPLVALQVSPQHPLTVDPDAYVGHLGNLQQTFVTDISWRMMIGQGSGEAFSLHFTGTGVVWIQPEER